MNINEQIVLITGAASGMGAATARYLSSKGAKIALLDVNLSQIKKIASEINGIAIACDVTDEEDVQHAFQIIKSDLKNTPRICVSCAGIAPAARLLSRQGVLPLIEFQRVININLMGTLNVMRFGAEVISTLEPANLMGERGVIINTASIAAFEGQIGQVAYSASKGAIVSMTLPAARELAQFGIRVMTIAPGLMNTPMAAAFPEKVRQSLSDAVPFPKRLGEADEFAQLVLQIIENPYLNGSVIRLDGALRMS